MTDEPEAARPAMRPLRSRRRQPASAASGFGIPPVAR